jgi:predicted PurR-regulated permease PerM
MKSEIKSTVISILLVIVAIFGCGYLVVAYLNGPGREIQKTERKIERQTNQESQQYTETQLRAIRDQINQYNANSVSLSVLQKDPTGNATVIQTITVQQQGIITFVKTTVKTLPQDSVPADVAMFVNTAQ